MRFFLILIGLSMLSSCAYKHEDADLVVHNATIYTCNQNFETHQAMAIKDGKILEVGPERQIRNKYSADKEIDMRARAVYPAFIGEKDPILAFKKALKEFQIKDGDDRKDVLLTLTQFKAIQEMMEDEQGTLEKGKKANFFVTNSDLVTIKWSLLNDVEVVETYVEGGKQ